MFEAASVSVRWALHQGLGKLVHQGCAPGLCATGLVRQSQWVSFLRKAASADAFSFFSTSEPISVGETSTCRARGPREG